MRFDSADGAAFFQVFPGFWHRGEHRGEHRGDDGERQRQRQRPARGQPAAATQNAASPPASRQAAPPPRRPACRPTAPPPGMPPSILQYRAHRVDPQKLHRNQRARPPRPPLRAAHPARGACIDVMARFHRAGGSPQWGLCVWGGVQWNRVRRDAPSAAEARFMSLGGPGRGRTSRGAPSRGRCRRVLRGSTLAGRSQDGVWISRPALARARCAWGRLCYRQLRWCAVRVVYGRPVRSWGLPNVGSEVGWDPRPRGTSAWHLLNTGGTPLAHGRHNHNHHQTCLAS